MEDALTFYPRTLVRHLDPNTRRRSVILLDIEGSRENAHDLGIRVDVAFRAVRLKRTGWRAFVLGQKIGYVGCSACTVEVEANNGAILSHSRERRLPVKYVTALGGSGSKGFKLGPKIKAKTANSELEASAGEATLQDALNRTTEAAYELDECLVQPTVYENTVFWEVVLPLGPRLLREYMIGNIDFSARCRWNGSPRNGIVRVIPDVSYYSKSRQEIRGRKAILLEYLLKRGAYNVYFEQGIEVAFRVREEGDADE